MSTLHGAGGLTGSHCPIPTEPRPIRQSTRPTGFAWGQAAPDPDAIERLTAAGVLTVTPEVVDGAVVKVVRKRKARRAANPAERKANRGSLDINAAAADYRTGMSTREVAEKHGVSQQWVSQVLRAHGVEMRNTGNVGTSRVDTERLVELRQSGMTLAQIAAEVGLAMQTVSSRLLGAGMGGIRNTKEAP